MTSVGHVRLEQLTHTLASMGLAAGWPRDRNVATRRVPDLLRVIREFKPTFEIEAVQVPDLDDPVEVPRIHAENQRTADDMFVLLDQLRLLSQVAQVPAEFRGELRARLRDLITLVTEHAAAASLAAGDDRYMTLGFSAVPETEQLPEPSAEGLFSDEG